MSLASDLQRAVAEKLAATYTTTIGDGVATEFALQHGFGSEGLYASIKEGGVALENGVDYQLLFTDRETLTIKALRKVPGASAWAVRLTLLRLDATLTGAVDRIDKAYLPIVPFQSGDMAARVEGAAASRELSIFVWPVLPTRIVQGVPFVFVQAAQVKVTIIEQPQINKRNASAFDLMEDVMNALHWQEFPQWLSHPLQLAEKPVEMIWEPSTRFQGLAANTRMIDVILEAVYGAQPGHRSQAFVTVDNELVTADDETITADSEPQGVTADAPLTADNETTTADQE